MAKIFLSYRRDDSGGYAGRVQDRLVKEFGPELLFMDVDAIPLGANFVKVLHQRVSECSVLLAVIGPHWLDAQDEHGKRRLDNPHDYVRIEIAAALQRDIPVVPILLEGTKIPYSDQLPDEIRELSFRNGLDVRLASFHDDCNRLIRGLKKQLDVDEAQSQADAPSRNERPKDAPPKEAPPEKSQTQIGAGILPIVGAIGALLSFGLLLAMVLGISSIGGTPIILSIAGTNIRSDLPLTFSPWIWTFCGVAIELLRPRYGLLKAAAIMTGLKFLLSVFSALAFGGPITLGNFLVALLVDGWFGISILGILFLYEWVRRRRLLRFRR